MSRRVSRTAANSKMERFVIIAINYYHKVLHLGCCSNPRTASDDVVYFSLVVFIVHLGPPGDIAPLFVLLIWV